MNWTREKGKPKERRLTSPGEKVPRKKKSLNGRED